MRIHNWNGLELVLPFDDELLGEMVIMPFNDLIRRYKTTDLHELERQVSKDYEGKLLCLPFGDRRIYFGYDIGLHMGFDFFLPEGTPIYAVADSSVIVADNFMSDPADWGNMVLTDTGKGLHILYAHIEMEPSVQRKRNSLMETLSRGELIGHVAEGWTKANGNWPAHLHLQFSKRYCTSGYADTEEELGSLLDPAKVFGFGERRQQYGAKNEI